MSQSFPLITTVCITSLIWIGWSYFFLIYIYPIPPETAEFATKCKTFCDVKKISDKEECFQKFTYQQGANEPNDDIVKHTLDTDKLSTMLNVNRLDDKQIKRMDNITLVKKVEETESCTCKALNKQIEVITTELERLGLNMSVVRGIQEYSDNAKADKGVKQVRASRETADNNYPTGDANMSDSRKSILDEIHRKTDLENSLCIFSFENDKQAKHRQMVNSVIDSKIDTKSVLVNSHRDLWVFPASKISMVFVDYNARNILLESERDLGDIRITTVKAIWNTGGNVVLVYCGDDYAKVTDNALYSHRITSIKSHEELKRLKAKQCVLTVKDYAFSDFQKKHLKNVIERFLNPYMI